MTKEKSFFTSLSLSPLKELATPSKWLKTVTLLAILYFASGKIVRLPEIQSERRLIRNENLMKDYQNGESYPFLAQKCGITQRWVRVFYKPLLNKE